MRNLLFISHRLPWPLNKGEKIRAWNVINHLSRDFHVHLGCVIDNLEDRDHVPRLQKVCASVGAFPIDKRLQKLRALLSARPGRPLMPDFYFSRALKKWVDDTLAKVSIDVVYIFSVAMGPYAVPLDRPGKILDAQDIDSEKWAQYAATTRWPMRAIWAREARHLFRYECAAASACDWAFFVSEPEARRFSELAPQLAARVVAVENGVDLDRFSPMLGFDSPFGKAPCLVFTGNMDYWPNADAVTWFARDVMPAMRARISGIEFWAVGANPGPEVRALARLPGVRVTGRVEDVRPYVAHASVVVCPLRIARGIQNKVLEGMAMGRPVIASSPAFEGVRAQAGRDLLVADQCDGFVDAVVEILEGRHPQLQRMARAAMEDGYAWSTLLGRMDALLSRSQQSGSMA